MRFPGASPAASGAIAGATVHQKAFIILRHLRLCSDARFAERKRDIVLTVLHVRMSRMRHGSGLPSSCMHNDQCVLSQLSFSGAEYSMFLSAASIAGHRPSQRIGRS